MELSAFTLYITEKCNYKCSYCYQKKRQKSLDVSVIRRALDFFFPFFTDLYFVNFYGGEPLLAFDTIANAVIYLQAKNEKYNKKCRFSLTTNGSLLDDTMLKFLSRSAFSLLLSFDGLAQDISRKNGSFRSSVALIEKILQVPGIELETNSVFTPETVSYLSKSLRFILELGVPEIDFSLSIKSPWNETSIFQFQREIRSLGKFLRAHCSKTGVLPLTRFQKKSWRGLFYCSAGRDRMTLAPDEKLWGCHLLADYFRGKSRTGEYQKYCFGDLESFISKFPDAYSEILDHHIPLRLCNFKTPEAHCLNCQELERCVICPVDAAFSSSRIGRVPSWICRMNKIIRKEKDRFLLQ